MGMEQILEEANYDLSNNINIKKNIIYLTQKKKRRRKEKP